MTKISILVLPEIVPSAFTCAWDVLNSLTDIAMQYNIPINKGSNVELELVSNSMDLITWDNGITLRPHRTINEVNSTDIIYIPTVNVPIYNPREDISFWIEERYSQGTILCGACTGAFILADTGLLNGKKATTHWAYIEKFKNNYPLIDVLSDRVIVTSGDNEKLVTSGGAYGAWQELMLYLTARFFGNELATKISKIYLIDWQTNSQTPYINFIANLNHNDASVKMSQQWLNKHYEHPNALELAMEQSGLSSRTYIRRFKVATGHTPINYLQKIRIEIAKQLLEETSYSIEKISTKIGYFDPSHFRQLFKRKTGITPSEYRKKFQVPGRFR